MVMVMVMVLVVVMVLVSQWFRWWGCGWRWKYYQYQSELETASLSQPPAESQGKQRHGGAPPSPQHQTGIPFPRQVRLEKTLPPPPPSAWRLSRWHFCNTAQLLR